MTFPLAHGIFAAGGEPPVPVCSVTLTHDIISVVPTLLPADISGQQFSVTDADTGEYAVSGALTEPRAMPTGGRVWLRLADPIVATPIVGETNVRLGLNGITGGVPVVVVYLRYYSPGQWGIVVEDASGAEIVGQPFTDSRASLPLAFDADGECYIFGDTGLRSFSSINALAGFPLAGCEHVIFSGLIDASAGGPVSVSATIDTNASQFGIDVLPGDVDWCDNPVPEPEPPVFCSDPLTGAYADIFDSLPMPVIEDHEWFWDFSAENADAGGHSYAASTNLEAPTPLWADGVRIVELHGGVVSAVSGEILSVGFVTPSLTHWFSARYNAGNWQFTGLNPGGSEVLASVAGEPSDTPGIGLGADGTLYGWLTGTVTGVTSPQLLNAAREGFFAGAENISIACGVTLPPGGNAAGTLVQHWEAYAGSYVDGQDWCGHPLPESDSGFRIVSWDIGHNQQGAPWTIPNIDSIVGNTYPTIWELCAAMFPLLGEGQTGDFYDMVGEPAACGIRTDGTGTWNNQFSGVYDLKTEAGWLAVAAQAESPVDPIIDYFISEWANTDGDPWDHARAVSVGYNNACNADGIYMHWPTAVIERL